MYVHYLVMYIPNFVMYVQNLAMYVLYLVMYIFYILSNILWFIFYKSCDLFSKSLNLFSNFVMYLKCKFKSCDVYSIILYCMFKIPWCIYLIKLSYMVNILYCFIIFFIKCCIFYNLTMYVQYLFYNLVVHLLYLVLYIINLVIHVQNLVMCIVKYCDVFFLSSCDKCSIILWCMFDNLMMYILYLGGHIL